MARYDLDEIKRQYDMRTIYPATAKRREYGNYIADHCIWHADPHPSMLVYADGYRCKQCGKHGDIIAWVMETQNTSFRDACRILAGDDAELKPMVVATAPVKPPPPPPVFHPTEPQDFARGMSDGDYQLLAERTFIEREAAESHMIGRYDQGIYTIPIPDECGKLADIKLYRPRKPGQAKSKDELKIWHMKEGAKNQLYGWNFIPDDEDYCVIVGGEKDAILGHQMGLPFITTTGGETSWDFRFQKLMTRFKHVYSWCDLDEAGWAGTMRHTHAFGNKVIRCSWVLWDHNLPKGYDFADYVAEGGTQYEFMCMLEDTQRGWLGTRPPLKQIEAQFNGSVER